MISRIPPQDQAQKTAQKTQAPAQADEALASPLASVSSSADITQGQVQEEAVLDAMDAPTASKPVDWQNVMPEADAIAGTLHPGVIFRNNELIKKEFYTQELGIYQNILNLSPVEYQQAMQSLQAQKVDGLNRFSQCRDQEFETAKELYQLHPKLLKQATSLSETQCKTLSSYPKVIKPAPSDDATTAEKKLDQLKWDLHGLYDDLLSASQKRLAAKTEFEDYANQDNAYAERVHPRAGQMNGFQRLVQSHKALKQQAYMDTLTSNISTYQAKNQTYHQQLDRLKTDAKVEADRTLDRLMDQTESRPAQKAAVKLVHENYKTTVKPPLVEKKMTVKETVHLKRMLDQLHQINAEVEQLKRPQDSFGFKLAHLKHELKKPSQYTPHDKDSEALADAKSRYNQLQSDIQELKKGIHLRQVAATKDAAFLRSCDRVHQQFDRILKLQNTMD